MRTSNWALLFGLALLVVLLGGCTRSGAEQTEEATDCIAIVWGLHQNASMPDLSAREVQEALKNSAERSSPVLLIVNDGKPFSVGNINEESTGKIPNGREQEVADYNLFKMVNAIESVRAVTPEVDTLEAIIQAQRALSQYDGTKYMYILDSGLSTTGSLNFASGNLLRMENADSLVEYLQEEYALPDLTGIHVVWISLGDVAGEQDDLTTKNKRALEMIWSAVLEAAGAEEVAFSYPATNSIAEDYDTLPAVTAVEILADDGFSPYETNIISLPFVPRSIEFLDVEEARELLRPTADFMIAHPDYSVVLAGTTATFGTIEGCRAFGLKRANAAKDLLLEMGVSEAQIYATVGLGYDNKFHVDDTNVDGSLNENAQANRVVLVMPTNLADAQYALAA